MTHVEYLKAEISKLESEVKRLRAERDSLNQKLSFYTRRMAPPRQMSARQFLADTESGATFLPVGQTNKAVTR